MTKLLHILLFSLLACSGVLGQNRLDTLRMKLADHPQEDSTRGQILLAMAYEYFNVDVDSMAIVVQEMIRLANKNQVGTQLIDGWRLMSSYHAAKLDFEASLVAGKRARAVADSVGNDYYQALASFSIAQNYKNLDQHEAAIPYLLEAKEVFDEQHKRPQLAAALRLLGSSYNKIQEWEKARGIYRETISLLKELNDKVWLAHLNVYVGSTYTDEGASFQDSDTARWHELVREGIRYYDSAIVWYENTQNIYGLGIGFYNLGTSYTHLNELEKAWEAFDRGLQYGLEGGNKAIELECRRGMAELLFKQQRYQEALREGRKILEEAETNGTADNFQYVYQVIANSAMELGEFRTAYEYLSTYHELELQPGASSSAKVRASQLLGEYEARMQQIELDRLAALEQRTQRQFTGLIGLGILLLLGGGIWIWQAIRLRRKNRELAREAHKAHQAELALAEARRSLEEQKAAELQRSLQAKQELLDEQVRQLAASQQWLEELQAALPNRRDPRALRRTLQQGMLESRNLDQIQPLFHDLHPNFLPALKQQYPDLSRSELRLAALYRMELGNEEMVDFLCINPASLKTFRTRLRKKLGLAPEQDLREFLQIL